ncbi:L-threonylcarbamoyladenylate synthase [Formivibrio citricus]|uniref:Threonylcarbamoyl-AMP synthase n=1 Tax=Formivibrio citricus TaxID=83765 RepID=A0A1I4XBB9_9NEIS|nr:L-threonylcarbamoyladenylate synthase [Formivibrio citricus]SFN22806.1 L-threonylcarbamoyladenylate synthase [Formivibrio citricus]
MSTLIDDALVLLRAGALVAIPTETVYGLAADAANPQAVARIFAAKGRPSDHPVIVHIAGAAQIDDWAREVPEVARKLAAAFWPGPLTLILKRQPHVPDAVTGGQDTVGLRAPAHPLTHELLERFGGGLAAPSANKFGHVSPTTAEHVSKEFGDAVPLVLDGGPCTVGVESTIISLVSNTPMLLRPGGVPREAIEAVLGQTLEHHQKPQTAKIRVSGLLDSHYAPRTTLVTGSGERLREEALRLHQNGERVALITLGAMNEACPATHCEVMPVTPVDYARTLYATLRKLDNGEFNTLLLESPPVTAEWLAVNDRLMRAAHWRLD